MVMVGVVDSSLHVDSIWLATPGTVTHSSHESVINQRPRQIHNQASMKDVWVLYPWILHVSFSWCPLYPGLHTWALT